MGFNWVYSLSGNIEKNEFTEIKNNVDYLSNRLSIPISWSSDIDETIIKKNVIKEIQDNIDLLHDNIDCIDHYASHFNSKDDSNYITVYNDDKIGVLTTQNSQLYNSKDITYLTNNDLTVLTSDNNTILTDNNSGVLSTNYSDFCSYVDNVVNSSKNTTIFSSNNLDVYGSPCTNNLHAADNVYDGSELTTITSTYCGHHDLVVY